MTDTKQTWKITHDDFGGYEIFDEKGDIIIQANENGSSLPWPVTAKLIVDSVNKVQQYKQALELALKALEEVGYLASYDAQVKSGRYRELLDKAIKSSVQAHYDIETALEDK